MADNFYIQQIQERGRVRYLSADEVTSGSDLAQAQRQKWGYGADGTYTETTTNAPFPVVFPATDLLVATASTIASKWATEKVMDGTTAISPTLFTHTSSSATTICVSGVLDKHIRVLALVAVTANAQTVRYNTSLTTPITGAMALAAATPLVLPFNPLGWFQTNHGDLLSVTAGAGAGNAIVSVFAYILA